MLKNLIEQYELLQILHTEDGSPEARQRMEDITYTLCVSMGSRDIDAALTTVDWGVPTL